MTTNLSIADYLKYADLQMAAEAFIRDPDTDVLRSSGQRLIDVLKDGNFHASRFTEIQATEFEKHWVVVDQEANTYPNSTKRQRKARSRGMPSPTKTLSIQKTESIGSREPYFECWIRRPTK